MADVAKAVESHLRAVREGRATVTAEMISELLQQVDRLRYLLEAHKPDATPAAETKEQPAEENERARQTVPATETVVSTSPARTVYAPTFTPERVDRLTSLSTVLHVQHMRLWEVYNRFDNLALVLERVQGAMTLATSHSEDTSPEVVELARQATALRDSLREAVEDTQMTLEELENEIVQLRLVPFGTLSSVLRRTVRDAARGLSKEVRLVIEGEETLIDREMLGPLQDALVHLLRNAVDHGIEAPEEREQAGKAREGTIIVRAAQRQGRVVVSVIDTGRGVDVAKVRTLAVERGLVSEEEARTLSDHDAAQLLFLPGFSTRSQVGAYSGQGVGLDAVADIVRRLGGDVYLEFVPGEGTEVHLVLPLNMALVDVLLVRVGNTRVALPLAEVKTILPAPKVSFLDVGNERVVRWGEHLVPVVSLAWLFGEEGDLGEGHLVVFQTRQHLIALGGGQVCDHVTLALYPVPAVFARAPGVYGTSILGDGSIVFVLGTDVYDLIGRARRRTGSTASPRVGKLGDRPRVLLVGHTLTTWEPLHTLLTSTGYEVIDADDASTALHILEQGQRVDAILVDVVSASTEGVPLVQQLRSHPRWCDIPVLAVVPEGEKALAQRVLDQVKVDACITRKELQDVTLASVLAKWVGKSG